MESLTNTFVLPVEKGEFTYVGEWTHVSQYTKIGKFCSIGNNCTIGAQDHNLKGLTTYPFEQVFNEVRWDSKPTFIGNDVWVGSNSVIKAGLRIGDGSVIGCGSVVLKDVHPYEIVVGNPGRHLKMRFDGKVIEKLLELRWWDLPIETIRILPLAKVEHCIDVLERLKRRAA